MELVMSRERRYNESGEEYYVICENRVYGDSHDIQVDVPAGSPGSPDFPACADCGSSDLCGSAEYTAEGSFDWWPLVCGACGSVFVVEEA